MPRYHAGLRCYNAFGVLYCFVIGWWLLMRGHEPTWLSLALIALGFPNLLVMLPPLGYRRRPR